MTQAPRTIPTAAEVQMNQRVRERVMRERRLRLVRNALFVVAISIVMLYVALLQRDTQARRTWDAEANSIAAYFQAEWKASGAPPAGFANMKSDPDEKKDSQYYENRYSVNMGYQAKLGSVRPVGVAALREPERMYLRPAGRIVILFDGEKFFGDWIPEAEFKLRREALGFEK